MDMLGKICDELKQGFMLFSPVFEGSADLIFLRDISGRFVWCNKAFRQFFGREEQEVICCNSVDLMPSVQAEKQMLMDRSVWASGSAQCLEEWFSSTDGAYKLFEITLSPLHRSDRTCMGILGICRDITSHKKLENSLRECELCLLEAQSMTKLKHWDLDLSEIRANEDKLKKLSQAVEFSPVSVVITDLHGTIEYVNPKFVELTGYAIEEVMGKNPSLLNSGIHPAAMYKDMWARIKSGGVWRGEICNRKKHGELYWEQVSISPIRNSAGEITHFVGVKEDISDRRQAECALQEARSAAESANQAKSAFLSKVSHELRTPMNAIIGMTELVLDSHLEHNQRDYLQKILYSSRMLLDIINDLLDLSKIEAGKLQLEKIDFDLYSLLNNLHGLLAIQAENKGLRCRYVVDDNVPQYLKGDPLRLGQILTNLLSNAIKFSFHGEVIVSVSYLQNIESGVLLHFSVQDSGIGLSTTEKERLFNAFYQADSSITRIYGGTGLGLTISRQLVEMMGGDIKVDSQPGIGSTFSFCAEFELAEKFSSSHNDLSNEGLPAVRMEHLDSIAGSRILLVEDNLFNREVARSFLQQSHFIVDSVTNGKDAVLGVQQNFFDAVLMDIQMPEMDGYEATIKIREDQKNQYLPIIAMTAYSTVGEREKCLASGMNDYISKPISKRYLFSKLLQWITPKPTQQRREQDHSHLSTDILSRELPNTFSRELPEVYTLPKSLPGLDIAKALRRLEIDAAFYIDLLDEMTREFGDACEQMQTYLPNSQIDNALMLLHTLKAMAGYLGANTLYLLTTDLESQLQHPKTKGVDWNGQLQNTDPQLNSSEQELGRLFGKWQKAMQEVLQSINMLKHSIVEYQSEEVLDSTTVCKDEIARELRNLQDAIKHSRFLSKFKLLQAKRLCGSPNNEEQWRNLIAEITRFDYEKAMYSLQQIAQSWDIVI